MHTASPAALPRVRSIPPILQRLGALSLAGLLAGAAPVSATPFSMTMEDRLACQEAIERVHHEHRIGESRPFAEAVPRQVLESKVRRHLGQSVALESFWATPVTGEMLRAEMRRIAAGSLLPERLSEIYDALDDDPLLVQECLARPALVDRLSRSFFARDQRIHARARREAERMRAALSSGDMDPWADHPTRTVVELVRQEPGGTDRRGQGTGESPHREFLDAVAFTAERGRAPREVGVPGEISEERGSFSIRVVLEEGDGRARVAVYSVAKVAWEEWWSGVEGTLDFTSTGSVPAPAGELPLPGGGWMPAGDLSTTIWRSATESATTTCDPVDRWDNRGMDDVPAAWPGHTAVWTGTRMIVWGGAYVASFAGTNGGGLYDPLTDTWLSMSREGAPSGRTNHTAVWTGNRMIVWGGSSSGTSLDTGGIYDPVSDTWAPMSALGAPTARQGHTAVWTGTEMIVWGGEFLSSGGRYDPATDTWAAASLVGAPTGRRSHTAVWTGSRMLIWGGEDLSPGAGTHTGGLYDPLNDTWEPTTLTGAPTGRRAHTAVWTGTEMIVFGGRHRSSFLCGLDDGSVIEIFHDPAIGEAAAYDPGLDTWRALPGGPAARYAHTAVWDGQRMIVTGGVYEMTEEVNSQCFYAFPEVGLATGGMLEPQTGMWTSTTTVNAPFAYEATAVWSGNLKLVWGTAGAAFAGGSRFDPIANAWTPIHAGDAPAPGRGKTAVWTGNEMIVWGGFPRATLTSPGGRYDPVADAWTPTSEANAPEWRREHSAVWTGQEMIVFGGSGSAAFLSTGGRYDPVLDAWTATAQFGAPAKRAHTAVWTGQEMVVWGGISPTGCCDRRYDPFTDSWTSVSATGAPSQRSGHTAVWTGSEMLIWGGSDPLGIGGRYSPASDAWASIATVGQPSTRRDHTAIWTGTRMIVWGGEATSGGIVALDTGGLYDPAADTWMPTTTIGAPSPRLFHTAVWNGSRMIVWGGAEARSNLARELDTGSRFDPAAGAWVPTPLAGAPLPRRGHTAVAAGAEMVVWGGSSGAQELRDGGRYLLLEPGAPCAAGVGACERAGMVSCADDGSGPFCDAVPGVPEPEQCDGIDNDCDGAIDNSSVLDGDGDGYVFSAPCGAPGDDCDDSDATVYPGAPEVCDGADNDCDGSVDEGLFAMQCTISPSLMNLNSGGTSFQVRVTGLTDLCDPGTPEPLDPAELSTAYVSRIGESNLPDPFAQACPVGSVVERGIVENEEARHRQGDELTLSFNVPSDGDCETLDGGRQELLAAVADVPDGTAVPMCVSSTIRGTPVTCCNTFTVRNTGNR